MKDSIQWGHHRSFYSHCGAGLFNCYFCGEILLLEWDNKRKRYVKMSNETVIHHHDEDRSNNSIENLAAAHWGCHTAHHSRKRPPISKVTRQKLINSHKGYETSTSHRINLSKANKGKPWTKARRDAQNKKRFQEAGK